MFQAGRSSSRNFLFNRNERLKESKRDFSAVGFGNQKKRYRESANAALAALSTSINVSKSTPQRIVARLAL